MPTTLQTVRALSDSEIIAVANELFHLVYEAIPYEEVSGNFEAVPQVRPLTGLDESALKRELPAAESARVARLIIEEYANDPALKPFVQSAVEKVHRSDELVVLEILTAGLVVNLTLLVATTRFKAEGIQGGKVRWELDKGRASPRLVKAVGDAVRLTAR